MWAPVPQARARGYIPWPLSGLATWTMPDARKVNIPIVESRRDARILAQGVSLGARGAHLLTKPSGVTDR